MQSTMMRTTPMQSRTSTTTNSFKASRACPKARKQVVVAAQAEERVRGPAKAASAVVAAVAAAQFALTGAALAVDPPILQGQKDTPQIFSPKDAQDIKEGRGQKPSPKYVEQAKKFAGQTAADKIADAPTINKEGGGVGRADFAPSQQPGVKAAGKANLAPKDIRDGTPAKTAGWMNVLPDLSAAPIVSKDAEAANDGKANLPKPGPVSNVLQEAGKKLTGSLPNAPDISNPKAAEGKPTISKLTNNKPAFMSSFQVVADVADAPLGDNKPNFPTPDVNPSNNQDVFKQLGDAIRGGTPDGPNPGKVGEGIAQNINGPDPKGAASKVSKNLPNITQKTDIAPESVGAEANVRNQPNPESFN